MVYFCSELITTGPEEVNFDHLMSAAQFRRQGSITNRGSTNMPSGDMPRSASSDLNWNKPTPVEQRPSKQPSQSTRTNNIAYPHQLQSINDLDSYVLSHESASDFVFRRARNSNTRRSLNYRNFPHSLSNSAVNGSQHRSSTSNLLANTTDNMESTSPETSQLLSFLNNGLEINTKLLTTTASSFHINSGECFSKKEENEEETRCYEQKSAETKSTSFVKLRRSSSIADVTEASSRHSYRRGITSAILKEEETTLAASDSSNEQNSSNKSDEDGAAAAAASNGGKNTRRLSSLKKLGSLYREFDELDDEYFEKSRAKKNTSSSTIKYIDENLDMQPKVATTKNTVVARKTASSTTDLDESYINAKFKYTAELRNGSNLVLDRIMKFEHKAEVSASADSASSPCNRSMNNESELLNHQDKSSSFSSSSSSSSSAVKLVVAANKVKSLSKNWEMLSSRHNSNSNSLNSSMNIGGKPLQIETTIQGKQQMAEKFALLDSTISSNSSSLASPNHVTESKTKLRLNSEFISSSSSSSSGTSSDNEHSSKDDGFETQSNASLSQKSDTTLPVKLTQSNAENKRSSESSVLDLNQLLINMNSSSTSGEVNSARKAATKGSVDYDDDECNNEDQPKFETFSCTAAQAQEGEAKQSELNTNNQRHAKQQQQNIVTITTTTRSRKKSSAQAGCSSSSSHRNGGSSMRPQSTSITTSITKKANSSTKAVSFFFPMFSNVFLPRLYKKKFC
jgi:hypothetical protein